MILVQVQGPLLLSRFDEIRRQRRPSTKNPLFRFFFPGWVSSGLGGHNICII
jgi:hypothetical protein